MIVELPGLLPDYSAGQGVGNFISGVANSAANFVCGLYRDYPAAVVSDTSPNSFGRGLMDSLCGDRGGLPPPPTPKVSGGQCSCASYEVTFTVNDTEGLSYSVTGIFTGPIRGLYSEISPDSPERVNWWFASTICNPDGTKDIKRDIVGGNLTKQGSVSVSGVIRLDGESDDCGGSGHDWSPNLPRVIPDNRLTGEDTVTYNDGTDITLPIVFAPVTVVNNVNPSINVDVGGVKVTFDFSGAKIDFGNNNNDPNVIRDRNNSNSDDFDRIDKQFKEIRDRLTQQRDDIENLKDKINDQNKDIDDIKKNRNDAPPPESDLDLDKEVEEDESDSEDKEVDRLEWVCIELTQLPNRQQFGGGAPNIYYAGWLEFKVGQCNLPRQPIHFEDSMFKAPDGATGFAYTLTNGAKGKVTVYKRKASVQ